jgi:hypothetical protein
MLIEKSEKTILKNKHVTWHLKRIGFSKGKSEEEKYYTQMTVSMKSSRKLGLYCILGAETDQRDKKNSSR